MSNLEVFQLLALGLPDKNARSLCDRALRHPAAVIALEDVAPGMHHDLEPCAFAADIVKDKLSALLHRPTYGCG